EDGGYPRLCLGPLVHEAVPVFASHVSFRSLETEASPPRHVEKLQDREIHREYHQHRHSHPGFSASTAPNMPVVTHWPPSNSRRLSFCVPHAPYRSRVDLPPIHNLLRRRSLR